MTRVRRPTPWSDKEHAYLCRLIDRLHGSQRGIADALSKPGAPRSREWVRRRLRFYGLAARAAHARERHGISGLPPHRKDRVRERERVESAIASGSRATSAKRLGVSVRTLYRAINRHGLGAT